MISYKGFRGIMFYDVMEMICSMNEWFGLIVKVFGFYFVFVLILNFMF